MSSLIDDLLIMYGIKINPGPGIKSNLTIRTFNCNGLGDINKFRRLLSKARNEVYNYSQA